MKQFAAGLLLGALLAAAPALAYYSRYTELTEMTAGDLEHLVEQSVRRVVKKTLNGCTVESYGESTATLRCY